MSIKGKKILHVAVGILWKKDQVLISLRPKAGVLGGFWEFPGGKQEQDETLESALKREMDEELGVEVLEYTFWRCLKHEYQDFIAVLHFFHVTSFAGDPQGLEGQSLQWIYPEDASSYPFLEADLRILAELEKP